MFMVGVVAGVVGMLVCAGFLCALGWIPGALRVEVESADGLRRVIGNAAVGDTVFVIGPDHEVEERVKRANRRTVVLLGPLRDGSS